MTIINAYPNWFETVRDIFEYQLEPYKGKPGLQVLQVGAYTGDASVWFTDNIVTGPGAVLHDVDTWEGSDEEEHHDLDWTDVRRIYENRTEGRPVLMYQMTSDAFFEGNERVYHIIYIDGDHTREQVYRDGVNAHKVLKKGGLLIFDDYKWVGHGDGENPGDAINQFLMSHLGEYTIIHMGYQMWLRRRY